MQGLVSHGPIRSKKKINHTLGAERSIIIPDKGNVMSIYKAIMELTLMPVCFFPPIMRLM